MHKSSAIGTTCANNAINSVADDDGNFAREFATFHLDERIDVLQIALSRPRPCN